jgi:hypothetical protein
MGRNRGNKVTLSDFIVKGGLKKRQNKFRWKNRDALRQRGSPALSKRKMGRRSLKKSRTLQQLIVAREIEEYDRQKEEGNMTAVSETAISKGTESCDKVSPCKDTTMKNEDQSISHAASHIDETTFRAHVLESIMTTLFPTEVSVPQGFDALAAMDQSFDKQDQNQRDVLIALDELDRRSMCRIVRDAIFWQARRQPFSFAKLYWFVPIERLAQCFVTPRVVTILLEETVAAKEPLERELRVMALTMIHRKLRWLEHTVLRSLYEWSSAHLQQQKRFCRNRVAPARELLEDGTCGHGHGLVKLWSTLVRDYAGRDTSSPGAKTAAGPEAEGAFFADPFVLLSRILGTFIRSPQLLPLYSDVIVPTAATLVGARLSLGSSLLRLLLVHWPRQDSAKELVCVRLLGAWLGALFPEDALKQQGVLPELCKRWSLLIQSPQAQVAQEAMKIIDESMFIFLRYVVSVPKMMEAVSEALHVAESHWNVKVRELAEKIFDRILDFK